MKTILKIASVIVVALCFTANVNAATKSSLLEYLTTQHTVNNEKVILSDSSINKVKNYFADLSLTDAQATAIQEKLDAIIDVLNNEGVTFPSKLSDVKKQEIFDLGKDAAQVIEATLTYDANSKEVNLVKDGKVVDVISVVPALDSKTGKYVIGGVAKKTGNGYTVYAAVSGLAIAVGAASIFKKLKANA